MKKKKNLFIMIGLAVVIIISITIGLLIYNKPSKVENKALYTITYDDGAIPGSNYEIQIYNDKEYYKVESTTTHGCSAVNCKPTIEKNTFNYSKENIEKLKSFINNNFSGNSIELDDTKVTNRQREVIYSLLRNEYIFETVIEDYEYKIEYGKSNNLSYIIYFKNDKSILVKKLDLNDNHIDTYSLNFSKENMDILNNYIEKEAKLENTNIIYKYPTQTNIYLPGYISKNEINILNSIIENKESYLNDLKQQ